MLDKISGSCKFFHCISYVDWWTMGLLHGLVLPCFCWSMCYQYYTCLTSLYTHTLMPYFIVQLPVSETKWQDDIVIELGHLVAESFLVWGGGKLDGVKIFYYEQLLGKCFTYYTAAFNKQNLDCTKIFCNERLLEKFDTKYPKFEIIPKTTAGMEIKIYIGLFTNFSVQRIQIVCFCVL